LSLNFELTGDTLPPGSGGTGSRVKDASMGDGCPVELSSPVNAWNAADRGVLGVPGLELASSSRTYASLEPLDSPSSSDTGARLLFRLGREPVLDLRCTFGGGAGAITGELVNELVDDLFAGSHIDSTNGASLPSIA
jgi:hypothetical protein